MCGRKIFQKGTIPWQRQYGNSRGLVPVKPVTTSDSIPRFLSILIPLKFHFSLLVLAQNRHFPSQLENSNNFHGIPCVLLLTSHSRGWNSSGNSLGRTIPAQLTQLMPKIWEALRSDPSGKCHPQHPPCGHSRLERQRIPTLNSYLDLKFLGNGQVWAEFLGAPGAGAHPSPFLPLFGLDFATGSPSHGK